MIADIPSLSKSLFTGRWAISVCWKKNKAISPELTRTALASVGSENEVK